MPECNWCLVKGHVLWHKSSRRMSSASERSHLRRHSARLRLPPSLPEMHAWSPLCLHPLLTSPSSFAECACISRAAAETLLQGSWCESAGKMDVPARVHRPPQTCCIHLNKAGKQQQWKKLINDFTSSSTTIIHKVNIATGFSSPTVILPMLFKYFHLTFNNTQTPHPHLYFSRQMGACSFLVPKLYPGEE